MSDNEATTGLRQIVFSCDRSCLLDGTGHRLGLTLVGSTDPDTNAGFRRQPPSARRLDSPVQRRTVTAFSDTHGLCRTLRPQGGVCMGDATTGDLMLEAVRERDVDLLVVEELHCSPPFQLHFRGAVAGLEPDQVVCRHGCRRPPQRVVLRRRHLVGLARGRADHPARRDRHPGRVRSARRSWRPATRRAHREQDRCELHRASTPTLREPRSSHAPGAGA